jgi:hypothetical protein
MISTASSHGIRSKSSAISSPQRAIVSTYAAVVNPPTTSAAGVQPRAYSS